MVGNYSYDQLSYLQSYALKIKNYAREKNTFLNRKYIYRDIKADEIPVIFGASDLVFISHHDKLLPGIASMAATYLKPVVYPLKGCYRDSLKDWISKEYDYGNVKAAGSMIDEIYNEIQNNRFLLDNSRWLETNSWSVSVELIIRSVNN